MIILFLIALLPFIELITLLLYPIKLDESPQETNYPFVSVLIAVRNEKLNIESLLNSFKKQNYPADKFEILIGDDSSTDNTLELVMAHKTRNSQLFAFNESQGRGKQFVLSELIRRSKGEQLLFTDADMIIDKQWINSMLLDDNYVGLKMGITKVEETNLFGKMQNIDWLSTQLSIAWYMQRGRPITCWGNNMVTNKATLTSIGGYDSIPPSLVEDVSLMRSINDHGGKVDISLNVQSVLTTKAMDSLKGLLSQRKRWSLAVLQNDYRVLLFTLSKVSYLPTIVSLLVLDPIFIVIPCFKILLRYVSLRRFTSNMEQKINIINLAIVDIYDFVIYSMTIVHILNFSSIKWKGRSFEL